MSADQGHADSKVEPEPEHEQIKSLRGGRSVLDVAIYACGTLAVIGGLCIGYLGVSGGFHNQRVLALWLLYFSLLFVLTGAFCYFLQRLKVDIAREDAAKEPVVKPEPEKPRTERAVMSFIETIPTEANEAGQRVTIFQFQNTGDIPARDVKVSNLEILLIDPDGICIHRRGAYGGPREVGRDKKYDVRIVADPVFQFHTTQVRFNLDYIAYTDPYGSIVRGSIPFCEEMLPLKLTSGIQRWFSCTDKPYPECRTNENWENPPMPKPPKSK
jgi:hypothetical protein